MAKKKAAKTKIVHRKKTGLSHEAFVNHPSFIASVVVLALVALYVALLNLQFLLK